MAVGADLLHSGLGCPDSGRRKHGASPFNHQSPLLRVGYHFGCCMQLVDTSDANQPWHSPSHQEAGLDAGSIACWKSLLPAHGPACGIRSARACTPFRAAPDVMTLATGTRRQINICTATVSPRHRDARLEGPSHLPLACSAWPLVYGGLTTHGARAPSRNDALVALHFVMPLFREAHGCLAH